MSWKDFFQSGFKQSGIVSVLPTYVSSDAGDCWKNSTSLGSDLLKTSRSRRLRPLKYSSTRSYMSLLAYIANISIRNGGGVIMR